MSVPLALQSSTLFEVKETLAAGRGIYARKYIERGTLLLETSDIAAYVIYQEYRKEVCAWCFAYDCGRAWKIRDSAVNLAFCGHDCFKLWSAEQTDHFRQAQITVENFCRKAKAHPEPEAAKVERVPSEDEVSSAWTTAQSLSVKVRAARAANAPSKAQRRALQAVNTSSPDRNTLAFLLSGFQCFLARPQLWQQVLGLANADKPYRFLLELEYQVVGFQQMLALLPPGLVSDFSSRTMRALAGKSAHNVFNIWSLEIDSAEGGPGSECMGYGLWPVASYWNHSCSPNVAKKRRGRTWSFIANAPIQAGEELSITYLGGDEKDMSVGERRDRLKKYWDFCCCCEKCRKENRC